MILPGVWTVVIAGSAMAGWRWERWRKASYDGYHDARSPGQIGGDALVSGLTLTTRAGFDVTHSGR